MLEDWEWNGDNQDHENEDEEVKNYQEGKLMTVNNEAYATILKQIPNLTPLQMDEVQKRITALRNVLGIPQEVSEPERQDDWILQGYADELSARGLGKTVPNQPHRLKSYQTYKAHASRVEALILEAIGTLTVVERRVLGQIIARALAKMISEWAAVSFDLMMRQTGRIPQALEQSFPGYLDAGMLKWLIRARRSA